eukprot:g14264.t1
MYLFKLLIASVTLYSACRALQQWRDYKLSAKWTILALTVRLVVTVFLSWLPWFYMLFPDENERPEFLNVITWGQMVMVLAGKRVAARLFIDVMLNLPVASVAMMLTPGVVGGARLVMELLPFTIVPYMIIFTTPLFVIGHGMANWKLLYGSLIYVGYCVITSWAAFRALASLEAFRLLGRKAVEKTGAGGKKIAATTRGRRDNEGSSLVVREDAVEKASGGKQSPTSGKPSPVSSASSFLKEAIPTLLHSNKEKNLVTVPATEKEPVVSRRRDPNNLANGGTTPQSISSKTSQPPLPPIRQRESSSSKESCDKDSKSSQTSKERTVPRHKSLARRGSGAMADIGSWVLRKMKSTEDLDEQTNLPASIFHQNYPTSNARGHNNSTRTPPQHQRNNEKTSTSINRTGSSTTTAAPPAPRAAARQSVELREAVVQGTLMSHLHSKMLPQVTRAWFTAFALFWIGLVLVLWGVYEEANGVMDVIFMSDSFWGSVVTMAVDAVINVLMIRICF